jgi:adenosylmethionine-8-amino-7-oxononanoate aminotransferase
MNYSERDKESIWHPYTQHFNQPLFPSIKRAEGNYFYLDNNDKILDAISSWWVNLHGHSHPSIISRVQETMKDLQQVMFAGYTHPVAIELAEKILALFGGHFSKAFYSDNGSTAVEVALKMCFQYWSNQNSERKTIIAFKNSYHGDTFGAMSVAERSVFSKPFWPFLFDVKLISSPLEGSHCLEELQVIISEHPEGIAGIIYEPLVQGAGGMLIQDAQKLSEVLRLVRDHGGLLLADEVMTGFGRTGKMFASSHLTLTPDIICLSKGLTGGFLPLGLTLATKEVFEAFKSSDRTKTLFHGHSFTGNALSCSAGLASLELLQSHECQKKIEWISHEHQSFSTLIETVNAIKEVRTLGTILAIEFETQETEGYLNGLGQTMGRFFQEKKILLRPLGQTLYVLPPYSFGPTEMDLTYSAILDFIRSQF